MESVIKANHGITREVLEEIKNRIKKGTDLESVCIQLGIKDVNLVITSLNEDKNKDLSKNVKSEENNKKYLESYKESLDEMIDTAKYEYLAEPTDRNAVAVTSLINTQQNIIKELDNRRDPSVISKEVLETVIQPMLKALIKTITIETSKARDKLINQLPVEYHDSIEYYMKDIMKGFGSSANFEYNKGMQDLYDVLGVKMDKTIVG